MTKVQLNHLIHQKVFYIQQPFYFPHIKAETAIYSLVNSLTELPGVLKVQLAVDGETEVKLWEKTLSTLFERNLEIIQVEESKKK